MNKVCSKCKIEKDVGEFYILRRNNRPMSKCKECNRNYIPKKDVIIECPKCKQKRFVTKRVFYLKQQEGFSFLCRQCHVKKEYGYASKRQLLGVYKLSAKKRNIEFKLSNEEFFKLTQQPCYYCGKELSMSIKSKYNNGDYIYNGIDRINNNIGYIIENCVPCCNICNIAKSDNTYEEFITMAKNIYLNLFKKEIYNNSKLMPLFE
jgi:DNA-directed RNA polymerase subunit RPC12/RpoP